MTARTLRLSARDVAIADSLARYGYLTTEQLRELHWPQGTASYARRRLAQLTADGLIERRRPPSPDGGGSLDYIYRLAAGGEKALNAGRLRGRDPWPSTAYLLQRVYVGHLALAMRAAGGPDTEWIGPNEAAQHPSPAVPSHVVDLALAESRPVLPDAAIQLPASSTQPSRLLLIEIDRAQRPWWQVEKLRRYDALICTWPPVEGEPPVAVFACRDCAQLEQVLLIAAHELRGRLTCAGGTGGHRWPGREHLVFALADDLAHGALVGLRLARPPLRRRAQLSAAPAAVPVALVPGASDAVVMERFGPVWARPEPVALGEAA